VLFYRPEDLGLRRFFAAGVPSDADVARVAQALAAADGDRGRVRALTGFGPRRLGRICNLLDELEPGDRADPTRAGEQAVALAESHVRLEQSRVEMMRALAETAGCRRQFLLGYFAEELPEPCGNCDTCDTSDPLAAGAAHLADAGMPYPVQSRVLHRDFGAGVVMTYGTDPDSVTVLFAEAGYRTLALDVVMANELLTPAVCDD
jgi:ATP-dependent DNA helicase RecQ